LSSRRRGALFISKAEDDGKETGLAQSRNETGPQERGLAQTALTEKHGQRPMLDPFKKIALLDIASKKVVARGLIKMPKTEPWAIGIDNPRWRHFIDRHG